MPTSAWGFRREVRRGFWCSRSWQLNQYPYSRVPAGESDLGKGSAPLRYAVCGAGGARVAGDGVSDQRRGALIPILLSIYLAFKNRLFMKSAFAVAVVALVTHQLAQPVRGVGVALPIFIPPIVALLCALVLSWRQAGPLAYIGGSMGTLIAADIMNTGKIQGLGAPVASIGGAGTFDGVFLVGIVAVLLASLIQPSPRRAA